jgi:hypothetical protein
VNVALESGRFSNGEAGRERENYEQDEVGREKIPRRVLGMGGVDVEVKWRGELCVFINSKYLTLIVEEREQSRGYCVLSVSLPARAIDTSAWRCLLPVAQHKPQGRKVGFVMIRVFHVYYVK